MTNDPVTKPQLEEDIAASTALPDFSDIEDLIPADRTVGYYVVEYDKEGVVCDLENPEICEACQ